MAKKSGSNRQSAKNVPVVNPLQLGGIETSVLDNGPGRGVRIAWINTGGGLRYKVLIDRGLDIADAEFNGQSLTWHSFGGVTAPQPSFCRGVEWLRGFYGGLVVSCGPFNTGAPFTENGVEYGLHGTHSNTAATIESIVNPDLARGQYEMSITGTVRSARVFGPNVELRRTISSTLGEPAIRISDEIVNRGNQPVEHEWLLHINFGYPLLAPGESTYCYKGKILPRPDSVEWFKKKDYRAAIPPIEAHRGDPGIFGYIDCPTDAKGNTTSGIVNFKRGLGVRIEVPKAEYPRIGNWQHWGPDGEYVGAIEPMTAGVEGRPLDAERGWVTHLQPGESRAYHCTITATADQAEIDKLMKLNK
jgi:hypothetical protein